MTRAPNRFHRSVGRVLFRSCLWDVPLCAAVVVLALNQRVAAEEAATGQADGQADGQATRQAQWPQFHGPNRDNRSTETGLLQSWPEGGPKRLWTADGLGHGFSSVAIRDGLIHTAGDVGDDTVITALDLRGRLRWRATNGRAWNGPKPGSRGTPTLDGEHLYHENPHGEVACFVAKTGQKVWSLNLLDRFHGENITWALAESLLVDKAHVICRPGGPEVSFVAIHKQSGRVAWTAPSSGDQAGYSSTALAEHGGLRILLAMSSHALIGANADTGELLFRFEHRSPWDENIGMPIYHAGQIFISTRTTGSVMLRLVVEGNRARVEEMWRSTELDNHHGGVVLFDGHIYAASHVHNKGQWICLDWATGRTRYVARGVGKGSVTFADGMLYTLGERRKMALVRATPEGHATVSTFAIPHQAKGPSWAHPVVCGGRLYIRHGDFLHAYHIQKER